MTLTEQIYAQALVLIQDTDSENLPMLKMLCRSAESALKVRLRPGLTPEDCKADFIAAASLYALAALSEADELGNIQSIAAGDFKLNRGGGNPAACCLRYQAEVIMRPYMTEQFTFMGV